MYFDPSRRCVYCGRRGRTYLDTVGLYACAEHRHEADEFFRAFLGPETGRREAVDTAIDNLRNRWGH